MPQKPMDIPTSSTWAKRVHRNDVNLADLEAHVLKKDRRFLVALGRRTINDGPVVKPSLSTRMVNGFLAVLVLLTFFGPLSGACAFFAGGPVPGRGAYATGDGFDTATAIFLAEWCFYLSIPGPIGLVIRWWLRGRLRDTFSSMCVGAAVVCGVLTIAIMTLQGVPLLPTVDSAVLPVWIVTVPAALVMVAVFHFSTGEYHEMPVYFPVVGPVDEAKLGELLSSLDPREKGRLRAARSRALNTLVERGIIEPAQKDEAEACEFGRLYTIQPPGAVNA